ncbi:hypothetical protein AB4305_11115 [Nocardia sp. 2YAB30]|uniref:hypothetical protein n=1 Tax=unclassified Nocardia TaxID=2637762 RepID=UPI003F9ACDBD
MGGVAGILLRGNATRTDRQRASLPLWGVWPVVTGLVFSYIAGIFHQYYTVVLDPAIATLVGADAVALWRESRLLARLVVVLGAALISRHLGSR